MDNAFFGFYLIIGQGAQLFAGVLSASDIGRTNWPLRGMALMGYLEILPKFKGTVHTNNSPRTTALNALTNATISR